MVIYLKKRVKFIISMLAIFCIFAFAKTNYISIQNTIQIFLESVMPSLFPFIFLTNIILQSNILDVITSKFKKYGNLIYIALIGSFCGYPMGAKATYMLYNKKLVSKNEAYFLMSFANNCNPIFILSTIGIGVLNNIKLAIILMICHYTSSLIICIYYFTHNNIIHKNDEKSNSFSKKEDTALHNLTTFEKVDTAIKQTFLTLSNILAFILLFNLAFSVVENILLKLNISENIIYTLSGIFEVTGGIRLIYLNSTLPQNITLTIISFVLSFSGMAIIFQIYSCIYKIPIKLSHIFKYKLMQGLISAIMTYILVSIIKSTDYINLNLKPASTLFNETLTYIIAVALLFTICFTLKKVTRKS